MAVSIKDNSNAYAYGIISLFDVPAALVHKAKEAQVQVTYTPNGHFYVKSKGGDDCGAVPIKPSVVTMAQNNNLGPTSKKVITTQIEKALQTAIAKSLSEKEDFLVNDDGDDYSVDPVGEGSAMQTYGMSAAHKAAIKKKFNQLPAYKQKPEVLQNMYAAKAQELGYKQPTLGSLLKAKLEHSAKLAENSMLSLSDATKLGQKVHGTSLSSVYTVVARLKGANIAVRHAGDKISIRVEPNFSSPSPEWLTYKTILASMGFKESTYSYSHEYLSVHYNCHGDMRKKALGAIIGAMGFDNLIETMDVMKALS